jgi:drug/metabolite transporter (DMT)-like permease
MRGRRVAASVAGTPSQRSLLAALVAVQVLFGGLAVAGKLVLPFVPPLALALLRLGFAAAVLMTLERVVVRSPLPPARDLARFAGYALLGVVLNQGLFLIGLQGTTATNAVLLVATIPAFTLLVAVLLGHENPQAWKVAGLAISFLGVALLVVGSGLDLGFHTLVGNLLIVANALSYSLYLVLSRPTLARYDPLTLLAWVFVLGFLEMALVAAPSFRGIEWQALTPAAWWALGYTLVGATVLTYGLNNWVLRHSSASRVASFVYLQPLFGALFAALVLHESLTVKVLLAGLLILAGVAVANRARPSRRTPAV